MAMMMIKLLVGQIVPLIREEREKIAMINEAGKSIELDTVIQVFHSCSRYQE